MKLLEGVTPCHHTPVLAEATMPARLRADRSSKAGV